MNIYNLILILCPISYTIIKCTGCNNTLAPPPLPQPKLKVAQYNQTYCRKVKSISAMDFQYFLYCINIYYISNTLEQKCSNSQKSHSKHAVYLLFHHHIWILWNKCILELKASCITLLLIPYF